MVDQLPPLTNLHRALEARLRELSMSECTHRQTLRSYKTPQPQPPPRRAPSLNPLKSSQKPPKVPKPKRVPPKEANTSALRLRSSPSPGSSRVLGTWSAPRGFSQLSCPRRVCAIATETLGFTGSCCGKHVQCPPLSLE